MNELIEKLKILLATAFAFRIKSQYYHWNIEGADFVQYHKFLGELYDEVDESIDEIAEHIRTLNSYAPGSFVRFSELSLIQDDTTIPESIEMLSRLQSDNEILLKCLYDVHEAAESLKKYGILNFIEGRIETHDKHNWMLKSLIKKD